MYKKWYTSKTLWFMVLFALVQVAGIFGYADYTPGTVVAEYIQLGVAVIGALLRALTSKGLEV